MSRRTGTGGNLNGQHGEEELPRLIERSAELKGDLVDFACSPRLKRSLAAAMLEADPEELGEAKAIDIIDRFAMQYRSQDGRTVLDRFVQSRPGLTAADREILLGWRDLVEGIFEIRGRDGDAINLLNLLDDLEYRTYSNMGPAAFRPLPRGGFVHARLVPIRPVPGVWLVSGNMTAYRKSEAGSGEYLVTTAQDLGAALKHFRTSAGVTQTSYVTDRLAAWLHGTRVAGRGSLLKPLVLRGAGGRSLISSVMPGRRLGCPVARAGR